MRVAMVFPGQGTQVTGMGAPWSVQTTPKYIYSGDGTGKIYRYDRASRNAAPRAASRTSRDAAPCATGLASRQAEPSRSRPAPAARPLKYARAVPLTS